MQTEDNGAVVAEQSIHTRFSCQLGTNKTMRHGPHLALDLLQLGQEMQCHLEGQTAQLQGEQGDTPSIRARGTRNQGLQQTSQGWSSAADLLRRLTNAHQWSAQKIAQMYRSVMLSTVRLCSRLVCCSISGERLVHIGLHVTSRQNKFTNWWYITLPLTCMLDLALHYSRSCGKA